MSRLQDLSAHGKMSGADSHASDVDWFVDLCAALDAGDFQAAKVARRALQRRGWSILPPKSWPFNRSIPDRREGGGR